MSFALPLALWALILIPLLALLYWRLDRRRMARTNELAAQGFAPTAHAIRQRRRRHVPPIAFALGLVALLVGVARPRSNITLPKRDGTVILAFDVSNSMRADDLKPTRMEAAKTAAKGFVAKQPGSIKIGLVAFSDGAFVTLQPSDDRDAINRAIDNLKPQGGTSLGQGMFRALNAISPKPIAVDPKLLASPDTSGQLGNDSAQSGSLESVEVGYFPNSAIVLLSDGENTNDPDPNKVAELASVAGVKIYPVGIGSAQGTVLKVDGFQLATKLDEDVLRNIAKVTNGTYRSAQDAETLQKLYSSIDLKWRNVREFREITGLFAGLGVVLLSLGALLSLRWFSRLV